MKSVLLVINILVLLIYSPLYSQDSIESINVKKDKVVRFKRLNNVQQKYLNWVDKRNMEFPFALPAIAYNKYDGVQIGAALINLKQPVKNVDFTGTLFYGIKSKKVTGTANVDYYYRPENSVLSLLKPGVRFQSFTYYNFSRPLKYYAIHPEITFMFNHRTEKLEKLEHQLLVRSNIVLQKDKYSTKDSLDKYYVNEFKYTFKRNDINFPFSASLNIEQANIFLKTSLEANSFIRYQLKDYNTGVHLRFFVGGFIWRKNQFFYQNMTFANYGFSLNGRTGSQDYFYNDFYVDRNGQEGFGANQISKTDGFFKTVAPLTIIGQTPNWLIAMNLKLDFPIKYVPLKFFLDLGYSYNNKYGNGAPLPVKGFQFDGGFMLSLFDEGFEVYFPLLYSNDYKTYYKSNGIKFGQRISFLMDLHKLELHKKIRDMKF